MSSKQGGVISASRPHDYVYDPLFTVPTARDMQRAAREAERRVAQIRLLPNFQCMFSELPHFPRAVAMRCPPLPLPKPSPAQRNRMKQSQIQNPASARQVTGVDRHKFFTSALESAEDRPLSPPPLIRCALEPWHPSVVSPKPPSPQPPQVPRVSMVKTPTPTPPRYRNSGTQTISLPKKLSVPPVTERRSPEAEERLAVRGRAHELIQINMLRLEQAGRLRGEHAAQASAARTERRNRLQADWEKERGETLSRLLASHNREVRKISQQLQGWHSRSRMDSLNTPLLMRNKTVSRHRTERIAFQPITLALPDSDTLRRPSTVHGFGETSGMASRDHPFLW